MAFLADDCRGTLSSPTTSVSNRPLHEAANFSRYYLVDSLQKAKSHCLSIFNEQYDIIQGSYLLLNSFRVSRSAVPWRRKWERLNLTFLVVYREHFRDSSIQICVGVGGPSSLAAVLDLEQPCYFPSFQATPEYSPFRLKRRHPAPQLTTELGTQTPH